MDTRPPRQTAWNTRPAPEALAAIVRHALEAGHLTPRAPALIGFDLDLLEARFQELVAAFPPRILHAVAIKANPLVAVLRQLVARGAGLEAASLEEVHLALAAGCPVDRVVYDSPAKTGADLAEALRLGIHLNVDNLEELERLARLRDRLPSLSTVGLRINPQLGEGRIRSTSVTSRGSRFGVPLEVGLEVLGGAFARHPWLTGLHVHVGSQGCSLEQLVAGVRRALELLEAINERLGRRQVTTLDIGGGLPTSYGASSPAPPSLEAWVEALRRELPRLFDGSIRLITELGRSLHANCGWAVSRVEYVKTVDGTRVATLHLGADFMLRTAYNPRDWPYEFIALGPDGRLKPAPAAVPWTLAGPLCFAGDILGREVKLPELEPGDLVVIRDTGAYTLSMWSRHCSRGIPAVVGHTGGGEGRAPMFHVLRARETPRDVVAFWSPPGDVSRE